MQEHETITISTPSYGPEEVSQFGRSLTDLKRKKRRPLRKLPTQKRLILKAATEYGLSDHFVGQLFGFPSTGRILREYRAE